MDGRDTNESVSDEIEVGVIGQLSQNQEEVRSIILTARENPDKTFEDGILSNLGYKDDTIIALVLAKLEIQGTDPTDMDVMWAGAMLDHLDTMGYQLVRKRNR